MTSKKMGPALSPEKGVQRHKPGKTLENQSGAVKKRYSQTVFKDWCKRCGICSAFCPKNVIGRDEYGGPVFERPEDCIGCRFCELHCPDFAITVQELDPDTGGEK